MDWKQIETKWAVMARRIRADVPSGSEKDTMSALLVTGKVEMRENIENEAIVGKFEITRRHTPVSVL